MAATFSLGRWQLSRAAEKQALQTALAERQRLPALAGAALVAPAADGPALLHRAVALRGTWLPERTVYLDNRVMDRRTGFYVLTPLRLVDADAVVLVQRGWAPRNFEDRQALPSVATPAGEVRVEGRVAAQPSRAYALGADGAGAIRQNLDLDAFRAETGLPLAPLVVWQTGEPSEGLLRQWPAPDSGVEKHHGYAFQWFGLCALIALLVLWFQVARPLRRSSSHD
ncbi:SURF1 family protein [Ottowia sp.]|uniref:SURF1 family protein n=1 Tax=Ottowia sp. TaxID=1898956 RepID=UPI0039E383F1